MKHRFSHRTISILLLLILLLAAVPAAGAAPATAPDAPTANLLRISQVYGGGGNADAPYTEFDFIEIFNGSSWTFNMSGWYAQYTSGARDELWKHESALSGRLRCRSILDLGCNWQGSAVR